MKNSILLVLCLFLFHSAIAQTNERVELYRTPAAPGFAILGIESTSIYEPSDPTDLFISVRNSTQDFSVIPRSYSLDFAPGWVFGGQNISFENFSKDHLGHNIIQNSTFSLATTTFDFSDSSSITRLGIGAKVSLLRGKMQLFNGEKLLKKKKYLKKLDSLGRDVGALVLRKQEGDSLYQHYQSNLMGMLMANPPNPTAIEAYKSLLESRGQQLAEQLRDSIAFEKKVVLEELKTLAKNIRIERLGFKLDVGGGAAFSYLNQDVASRELYRYGAWINGGNNFKIGKNWYMGVLGAGRLWFNPGESYVFESKLKSADLLRIDAGIRLLIKTKKTSSLSLETLYRTVLNNDEIDPTFKVAFNFDYAIAKNQVLTMSFGRDFNGTVQKGGNLIAAVNLLFGLGADRPVQKAND